MHVNRQLARVFEEHTVRSLAEAAQLAAIVRAQYQRQGKAFDLAQMRGGRAIMSDAQVIAEDGSAVALEERSAQVALRTGKLHSNQVMGYPRPDGSYLWLSSTSQPLYTGAGAAPTGVFTTVTDVTARKQAEAARDALEAQLRESQKMEAMGTLAGGIAHDFNNMLGAILGNVALARTEKDAGHPAAVSLDEIGRAGARARRLVQQILPSAASSRRCSPPSRCTEWWTRRSGCCAQACQPVCALTPAWIQCRATCKRTRPRLGRC